MKKIVLYIIILITSINMMAQENSRKFDFKIGAGYGFMGNGDLTAHCFENELNYKLNNYFSASVGVNIGRSAVYKFNHNDYLYGSINMYISPFRNNKINNFKIGAGYILVNETISYLSATFYYYDTYMEKFAYTTSTRNGFNIIIEDEYLIHSKYLVGGKLFTTAGFEGAGIVSGGMIKLGIVF